ncbi:MAG TPA: pyrroline-5-carboxylate reductase [Anaerolineales bacterium]|nr:pyrroline-5-carboxylate reductase [Anaerolineales bacterium]
MFDNKRIVFIGPGVMAEAMIAGLIRQEVTQPPMLLAAGPRLERGEDLKSRYGIEWMTDNVTAARAGDIVVLSVKPQRLDTVLEGLHGIIKPDALILSIVAGASIAKISGILDHKAVIRAMPNTPAQIGEGITVWTAAPEVSEVQREMGQQILAALGQEIFMEEETYLNMATALSGTGPAYVFLFMEAMVDAGVHLGFPRRVAEQLVAQTVRGSVDYYTRDSDPMHLARLRNQVTSPGGTSAAALYYLEKAGFRTAISRAVWAAYERSRELGKDARAHWPENVSQQDDG